MAQVQFHQLCAVRQRPEPEILEIDVLAGELRDMESRLAKRGFETVFVLRSYQGTWPRPRRGK